MLDVGFVVEIAGHVGIGSIIDVGSVEVLVIVFGSGSGSVWVWVDMGVSAGVDVGVGIGVGSSSMRFLDAWFHISMWKLSAPNLIR